MKGPSSTPPRRTSTSDRAERPLWRNLWLRLIVSIFLLFHLAAVAIAPFAVLTSGFGLRTATPGPAPPTEAEQLRSSELDRPPPAIVRLSESLQPYLDLLYLNHGYSFFAPEPSASYVIEYEIEKQDGQTVQGRLPDLDRHWPRLLYHRYFMLSSQNYGLTEQALANGRVPQGSNDTLAHAIAKHLNESEGGTRTVLRLLVHRLLWPEDVRQGKPLDATDTYVPIGEITYVPSAAPDELGAVRQGDVVAIAREVRP